MAETLNEVRLRGLLVSVDVEDTGKGKRLARLVIETDPPAWMENVKAKDRVLVIVFGRTVEQVAKLKAGQNVAIMGRMRGREYGGKWYVDIIGEKFGVR